MHGPQGRTSVHCQAHQEQKTLIDKEITSLTLPLRSLHRLQACRMRVRLFGRVGVSESRRSELIAVRTGSGVLGRVNRGRCAK
jgi:hypothetical protein